MTRAAVDPARVMVLWCPDWPVSAAIEELKLDAQQPIALIHRGEVFACSALARAAGVKRGLRVREAQSRCTKLQVASYHPGHDLRVFQPVLAAVTQLMPGVQLLRPGTCAIRLKGPARYFGGERQAAEVLRQCASGAGVQQARVGIADGIFAAEQAARLITPSGASAEEIHLVPPGRSAQFLAPLPLDVLEQADLIPLLHRLGLETLGDFAALAADKVRRRFGEPGARAHLLASGLDPRSVVPQTAPVELDVALEFEPPINRVDQLAFAVKTSAERFIDGVSRIGQVCTALRIRLESDSGEQLERLWKHPRFFDAEDVLDRVRWQLQGSTGPGEDFDGGLTAGITKVLLSPESTDDSGSHVQGLWGDGPQERIHHGLSRIQSLVGHGAVLTAVLTGGRMLAQRSILIPWVDSPPAELNGSAPERSRPWPGSLPGPAPAILFQTPLPVEVLDSKGRPITISERLQLSGEPAFFTPPPQTAPSAEPEALTVGTAPARGGNPASSGLRPQRQQQSGAQRLINAWAGPWPVDERWWEPAAQKLHRFQIVDSADAAWLLFCRDGQWLAEASYD